MPVCSEYRTLRFVVIEPLRLVSITIARRGKKEGSPGSDLRGFQP